MWSAVSCSSQRVEWSILPLCSSTSRPPNPNPTVKHIKHRLTGEERLYPVDKAMWNRQAVLKGVPVSPITVRVEMGIKVIVLACISYLIIVQHFSFLLMHLPLFFHLKLTQTHPERVTWPCHKIRKSMLFRNFRCHFLIKVAFHSNR